MKKSNKKSVKITDKRALRVRRALHGTAERPRMCVVKTNKHIYVQLIDDVSGTTVAAFSTMTKENREAHGSKSKASGSVLGEQIAKKAVGLGLKTVIFDRGPNKYHGILASLADAARQHGLQL